MSNVENTEQAPTPEKKKISLQEAIKQKLANKKQNQSNRKSVTNNPQKNAPVMKSQQTKKRNNQRKRTGV